MRLLGLNRDRRPASVAEAQTMIAYNERILATSQSHQRRDRAARMLANVRPELTRLEQAAASAVKAPRSRDEDEFEVVFSGKDSLYAID